MQSGSVQMVRVWATSTPESQCLRSELHCAAHGWRMSQLFCWFWLCLSMSVLPTFLVLAPGDYTLPASQALLMAEAPCLVRLLCSSWCLARMLRLCLHEYTCPPHTCLCAGDRCSAPRCALHGHRAHGHQRAVDLPPGAEPSPGRAERVQVQGDPGQADRPPHWWAPAITLDDPSCSRTRRHGSQ